MPKRQRIIKIPELSGRKYRVQVKNIRVWLPFAESSLICLWAILFLYPFWVGVFIIMLIYNVFILLPFIRELWIERMSLMLSKDGMLYQNLISAVPTAYRCGYLRWGSISAIERYSSHTEAFTAAVADSWKNGGILTTLLLKIFSIYMKLGFNQGDYLLIRYHSGGFLFSPPKAGEIPGRIFCNGPEEVIIINIALLAENGNSLFARINNYWQPGKI